MKKISLAIAAFSVFVFLGSTISVFGQVTTTQNPDSGLPLAIPDNTPAGVNLNFTFSGLTGSLTNVRVLGVTWSPNHSWGGDITMTLAAPGGSPIATIHQRRSGAPSCGGNSGSDLVGPYTFRDDPTAPPGNFQTISGTGTPLTVPSGEYQANSCVGAPAVVLLNSVFAGPVFAPDFLLNGTDSENKAKGLEVFKNLSPEAANGIWTLNISDNVGADTGTVSAVQLSLVTNVITAANASVSGRVLTSNGRGIPRAFVTITGGGLTEPRFATTGTFGFYRFEGLEVGNTYILSVNSKGFTFLNPNIIISLKDNIVDANFEAHPY